MNDKLICQACNTEMQPNMPPFPPQIMNGGLMSSVAMLNGQAECPKCHAKYVTQIAGIQVQLGFTQVKEEPKIVVPHMVPPNLRNLKAG